MLKETVADQRPQLDRLVKTGTSLQKLIGDNDSRKLQIVMDEDSNTFSALKNRLRDRAAIVDEALQQTAEVCNTINCKQTIINSNRSFLYVSY